MLTYMFTYMFTYSDILRDIMVNEQGWNTSVNRFEDFLKNSA